jgi:hypothetical protein
VGEVPETENPFPVTWSLADIRILLREIFRNTIMVAIKSFLSAGAVALLIDAVSAQTFQRLGTCPKLGKYLGDQLTSFN